ncbi:MAG TPA: hypothetical protein VK956_11490, partial [Verrucomicrobium sp.]|nr:hypothetical protein [Verrucomicrobium sp.]
MKRSIPTVPAKFSAMGLLRWVPVLLALVSGPVHAQSFRGGTQLGPSFDDLSVLVYRMVVVESKKPLVQHGAQMTEADFAARLEQWRTSGSGAIVIDKGFILPEGTQPIDPNFAGAGGRALMMGTQDNRTPGPAIKLRAERTDTGFHSEVSLSVWAMTGHSLKDSLGTLDNPGIIAGSASITPGVKIGGVPCRQGPEVQHSWDSPLRTVTALNCDSGDGSSNKCTVFLNPLLVRPSLIDQPGIPKTYQDASLRMVGGAVPSGSFWNYIKSTRPDIVRPKVMGGGILELFWSDEEWQSFTDAMKQLGTGWANLPDAKLTKEKPSVELNVPQMAVTVALEN